MGKPTVALHQSPMRGCTMRIDGFTGPGIDWRARCLAAEAEVERLRARIDAGVAEVERYCGTPTPSATETRAGTTRRNRPA